MTMIISIYPEPLDGPPERFRATGGGVDATGETVGQALDALRARLACRPVTAAILIEPYRPDEFFTAAQMRRLCELMQEFRRARDAGRQLPPELDEELTELINAELESSVTRLTTRLGS